MDLFKYNKRTLIRLGFFATLAAVSVLIGSPMLRVALGGSIVLCALLIIVLTYKKPKCNHAKARIQSIKEFEHESQYNLRFSPKECAIFPKDNEGEAFYATTPRYENSFKKGEVGDTVEAGWYEYNSKMDGSHQIKSIILEKGYYIYARKFVKFYFLALAVGCGICVWGIIGLIAK